MQLAASDMLDLSRERKETLQMYGIGEKVTDSYGRRCLIARRLVERGVRFVQLFINRQIWDTHTNIGTTLPSACHRTDKPIAGLLADLKQRGLFDDVLLVFCTEFGRSPWAQDGKGTKSRTHHPSAFSCWLAGGGIRPGIVYGKTDDIGNHVEAKAVHIHDFHATILHIMGLDHERLIYRHAGRDFRLTDVHGKVIHDIVV